MRKFLTSLIIIVHLFMASIVRAAQEPIRGVASYYSRAHQGKRMANGKPFDLKKMTAACLRFPLGTRLQVRSIATGRIVIVQVTDRGPFKTGRLIDLSEAAAVLLGIKQLGVSIVEVTPI